MTKFVVDSTTPTKPIKPRFTKSIIIGGILSVIVVGIVGIIIFKRYKRTPKFKYVVGYN